MLDVEYQFGHWEYWYPGVWYWVWSDTKTY
jgi:hypothetical protein